MNNEIWNRNKECMSRDELRDLQGKRLHKLVDLVYHNTPFYRHKMQELDLLPADIRTIDDIVKLPFTTKADLRDNYPVGLLATPMSEIVRIHASSGTTGSPTIVGYTSRDEGNHRACFDGLRRDAGRHRVGGLRLRAVHRRFGRALRG